MKHEVIDQDEALEVIAEYLERLGVDSLRQPNDPAQVNKSAVIRYIISEKLDEAMDNPPAPAGAKKRVRQGTKKKHKPVSFDVSNTKSRS